MITVILATIIIMYNVYGGQNAILIISEVCKT